MAEIIVAKSAGFCFGVNRAINMAYDEINKNKNIYTYGPLIHNKEVIADLEKKGIHVIKDLEEVEQGTVMIRSHGVGKQIYEELEHRNFKIIDGTCPFVKRIHKIVEKESSEGKRVVIIGNAGHPEVEGIMGWSKTQTTVIGTLEEAQNFPCNTGEELCIVSQTTFNYNKFQDMVEIFKEKGYNGSVVNTICNATEVRQTEARKIAAKVDVMIVIGGNHSSNTRKLYEICRQECENTYFIQTLDDLHLDLPKSVRLVGITAGASTPNNIIEEVQNYVRINF